jgi:hypothetical protein
MLSSETAVEPWKSCQLVLVPKRIAIQATRRLLRDDKAKRELRICTE